MVGEAGVEVNADPIRAPMATMEAGPDQTPGGHDAPRWRAGCGQPLRRQRGLRRGVVLVGSLRGLLGHHLCLSWRTVSLGHSEQGRCVVPTGSGSVVAPCHAMGGHRSRVRGRGLCSHAERAETACVPRITRPAMYRSSSRGRVRAAGSSPCCGSASGARNDEARFRTYALTRSMRNSRDVRALRMRPHGRARSAPGPRGLPAVRRPGPTGASPSAASRRCPGSASTALFCAQGRRGPGATEPEATSPHPR